ncbi:WD40 repeat domain-containing protein [Beijerinckia sp. L45]|uniref:WD40 repeat domain-containing protein n=1 Tax=Beijerinckia sp. L45 TaxID=1641855 RepID=UPI00131BF7DE|nr:WD40 repeat domain-containing protein [Beijerinckia sp. L45]
MVDEKTQSLRDHVVMLEAGAPVSAVAFLGKTPAIVLDGGEILLGEHGAQTRVAAHPDGAILVTAQAGKAVVTGGDDGRVVRTDATGACEEISATKGRWIDALTARDDGAIAWACGKDVFCRDAKGATKRVSAPTTARGLVFTPKGYRVAMAYYGGAALWFPNTESPPEAFEWKGSHLDVTVSPDGRFLVTSMQENALHGWRIADKAHMRMSGYPAKVRSMSWSADGFWLATSGADSCVIWPFKDKDGPMNKQPRELAARKAKVARVACNSKALLLAIGFEDGWILLVRLNDGSEMLVRRPDGDRSPITALVWSNDGTRLLFGTEAGEAGLLTLP